MPFFRFASGHPIFNISLKDSKYIFILQIAGFSYQIFLLRYLKFYVVTFNFLKLLIKGYVSCCEIQKKFYSARGGSPQHAAHNTRRTVSSTTLHLLYLLNIFYLCFKVKGFFLKLNIVWIQVWYINTFN